MKINLLNTQLFSDIKEKDMEHLMHCLNPIEKEYKKGNTILYEGEYTESLGVLLSGMVIIEYCDVWGNNNILGNVLPGAVFAEVYSCIPRQKLLVSVVAAEDSKVMFININKLLHTCGNSCLFHTKLIKNLSEICASKNIQLSQRILHTTSKSIRGRLMSYFSECIKKYDSYSFDIPYNRQQLADYLGVDRSTMCNELSKMQKEEIILYKKNHFVINDAFSEI